MWTVHLKRLMIMVLGIALLAGTLPVVIAAAHAVERDQAVNVPGPDMSAAHQCTAVAAGCQNPEKMPTNCPRTADCISSVTSTIPAGVAVSKTFDWMLLVSTGIEPRIAGITVSPELSPPIDRV